MDGHVHGIDPDLAWEVGPAVRTQGDRLVITPESRKDLRPLVRAILAAAPTMAGWEFHGHRPPGSWEMACQAVAARCAQPPRLTVVEAAQGEGNRIDLTFGGPSISDPDDQDAMYEALVLTEALLGEEVLDCWIGAIELRSDPPTPSATPIAGVKGIVDRLIDEIRQGLRERPYLAMFEDEGWSLVRLKPREADDYPEQADLAVARAPHLPLLQATRTETFYDRRFTRCGETFCYVKLDGAQGLASSKFADKAAI
jgi:hypothetical protein